MKQSKFTHICIIVEEPPHRHHPDTTSYKTECKATSKMKCRIHLFHLIIITYDVTGFQSGSFIAVFFRHICILLAH